LASPVFGTGVYASTRGAETDGGIPVRWKWILGIVGLVVLGLVLAVYVIMKTYDFNKLKPEISQAVYEATGRKLALAGDFKLAFGLSPSVSVAGVDLQNAPWGSKPEMVRIKRMEIQIALLSLLRGNIEFKRLILVQPDILLERNRSGVWNLEFKPAETPKPVGKKAEEKEALPPLIFDEIRIEEGVLTYHDERRGKTLTLAINSLDAALPGGGRQAGFKLRGTFNGQPLEIKATTGPLADLMAAGRPWPIKVNASAGGANGSLEGSIREALRGKGLDLAIKADGPSIRKVAELGGVADAPDLGPFKLSANLRGSVEKLNLTDLKLTLAGSDLAGSSGVDLAGKEPRIEADLSSQKLDLRPFFPKGEEKVPETQKPGGSTAGKNRIFPGEPLPLAGLKAVDAHIKLQAGRLQVPGLAISNLKTEVTLENGNLAARPLEFILSGGRAGGFFTLHTGKGNPAFTLNLKAEPIDLGSLLKDLEVKQILEGKLDAEVELSGQGRSIAEWMAGLNGRAIVLLGKGRLRNKYLDLLGADLAQSILGLINPLHEGKEGDFAKVNCLVSGFEIHKGIAACTALVLDTDQMSVAGAGDINLRDERLNLSFQPSPKQGISVAGLGKISLSLAELSKPFKLGGTLAHPSLALDPRGAVTTIGKAVILGPAGILAALASASPSDKNPCLAAIEEAKRKGKPGEKTPEEEKVTGEGTKEIEILGKELQKIFK
jgi:uncharacterized protein involved in outer membrane biogenesis